MQRFKKSCQYIKQIKKDMNKIKTGKLRYSCDEILDIIDDLQNASVNLINTANILKMYYKKENHDSKIKALRTKNIVN